jgi:2-hydroxyacyl-CoA lyase 1
MGKGIVADSSPHNYSAARSTAFKEADVVLVLGARLNWILAFGLPPKWSATVKIVQVDICADELGKNGGDPALSLLGDVGATVQQLMSHLGDWQWQGQKTPFLQHLDAAQANNRVKASKKAAVVKSPMMFEQAFNVIKTTLDSLSTPADGDIVYVSEGANAMDISRTIFTMEHPRTKLDAGTYATMGVGLGTPSPHTPPTTSRNPKASPAKPSARKSSALKETALSVSLAWKSRPWRDMTWTS